MFWPIENFLEAHEVKKIIKIAYLLMFSPPQVAKMSVTNAKISVTKFASKCHKL